MLQKNFPKQTPEKARDPTVEALLEAYAWSGWLQSHQQLYRLLRSVKACLEISAIRNVWAAASRAIVQWKNGACLIEDSASHVSIQVSGPGERRPFPHLFEHRVRSLCVCERLRTIAVVFSWIDLSFLLFSVVVVGFSCFQMWEMLGQVKKMDMGVANFSLRSCT